MPSVMIAFPCTMDAKVLWQYAKKFCNHVNTSVGVSLNDIIKLADPKKYPTVLALSKPSYGQLFVQIAKFSLPCLQGSVGATLNDTKKLADPKLSLVQESGTYLLFSRGIGNFVLKYQNFATIATGPSETGFNETIKLADP